MIIYVKNEILEIFENEIKTKFIKDKTNGTNIFAD